VMVSVLRAPRGGAPMIFLDDLALARRMELAL